MELVINISEEWYNKIKGFKFSQTKIEKAIANGTPLPKGHGELIDRSKLCQQYDEECVGDCDCCPNSIHENYVNKCAVIENAEVLVKADKGDREC